MDFLVDYLTRAIRKNPAEAICLISCTAFCTIFLHKAGRGVKASNENKPVRVTKEYAKKANEQLDVVKYWDIQEAYNELVNEVIEEAERTMRNG